jgi:hypothetical protein
MLRALKDIYKKSEAAAVVKGLLERQQRYGFFTGDAAKVAAELVAEIWSLRPNLFNGTNEARPHKMNLAASSLANGITAQAYDKAYTSSFTIALGILLTELEENRRLYSLNGLDLKMASVNRKTYFDAIDRPDRFRVSGL